VTPPAAISIEGVAQPERRAIHRFTIRFPELAHAGHEPQEHLASIEDDRHLRQGINQPALDSALWVLNRNQPVEHPLGALAKVLIPEPPGAFEHGRYDVTCRLRI
jgi:hypothetical protein